MHDSDFGEVHLESFKEAVLLDIYLYLFLILMINFVINTIDLFTILLLILNIMIRIISII